MNVLTNYVNHINSCPQYYGHARASRARAICSMKAHGVMQRRDQHGRRVYIYRPGNWNPDKFKFEECFALGYMISELLALEPKTQIAGVTTVADASGFGWKQFRHFSLDDARNSAKFIQVRSSDAKSDASTRSSGPSAFCRTASLSGSGLYTSSMPTECSRWHSTLSAHSCPRRRRR